MKVQLEEENLLHHLMEPDWVRGKFLPLLKLFDERSECDLFQANRTGTLEEIKYRQGWFDAVHTLYGLINGITKPNQTIPSRHGLLASMFGWGGENNA